MTLTIDEKQLSQLIVKLKANYPGLTSNDLHITNNNVKSMLTMVAYKLRKNKEEMNEIVENL